MMSATKLNAADGFRVWRINVDAGRIRSHATAEQKDEPPILHKTSGPTGPSRSNTGPLRRPRHRRRPSCAVLHPALHVHVVFSSAGRRSWRFSSYLCNRQTELRSAPRTPFARKTGLRKISPSRTPRHPLVHISLPPFPSAGFSRVLRRPAPIRLNSTDRLLNENKMRTEGVRVLTDADLPTRVGRDFVDQPLRLFA